MSRSTRNADPNYRDDTSSGNENKVEYKKEKSKSISLKKTDNEISRTNSTEIQPNDFVEEEANNEYTCMKI